jgi:hypothetical protein
MARTKHVFDTSEIAHLWAHQTQESARNKQNNFSFRGLNLYSYSAVIARLILRKGQPAAVLLSRRHWSSTTNSHQSQAWRATTHLEQFYVETTDPRDWRWSDKPGDLKREEKKRLDSLAKDVATAKNRVSRAKRFDALVSATHEANRLCRFFGLVEFPVPATTDEIRETTQRIVETEKRRAARVEAAHKQARAERERINADRLQRWLAGESVPTPYCTPDRMRIVQTETDLDDLGHGRRAPMIDDDGIVRREEIQTTKGATVPASHVRRVGPMLLYMVQNGIAWHSNGRQIRVGHYTLDSVDELGTVRVGCHTFERAEIERIAGLLGIVADGSSLGYPPVTPDPDESIGAQSVPAGWDSV